jgi:hypothetical protein
MASKPPGPPLDWTEEDLAALAAVSPADVKALLARWRADAPPWAKALLEAQPEDVG